MEWQRGGLQMPQAVRDATAAYLDAEDAIATWIEEKCPRDPSGWESSADLFGSWADWATKAGEFVGSSKSFAQKLETRGFLPRRDTKGKQRGFGGLRLIREAVHPGFHGDWRRD